MQGWCNRTIRSENENDDDDDDDDHDDDDDDDDDDHHDDGSHLFVNVASRLGGGDC